MINSKILNIIGIITVFLGISMLPSSLWSLFESTQFNTNDIEILIRKGKSCETLGKTEQAIECFNQVLSIQSSNVDALRGMAIIFINQEKYEEAMVNIDQILLADPNDFEIMYFKGIVLEQLGRNAQAVNYYLKSLKINQKSNSNEVQSNDKNS